jgi:hypothetical protein
MTTSHHYKRFFKEFCTLKENKNMRTGSTKPKGKKKTRNQRITTVQLHTIKPLNNKNNKMTEITTYLSILTLSVNALNSPNKRHHLANWIKREDPTMCYL